MSSQHSHPMDPEEIHLSRFYSPVSPIPSTMSQQPAPLFSQAEILFPKRLPPTSQAQLQAQPHDLVETDLPPRGVPSDVDTCQLSSPLYHPPQPYYNQDYAQNQSDQQTGSHPDQGVRDYPFSFQQDPNRAYQPDLSHQPDQDRNHHLDLPTHVNQRQLQINVDLDNTPNRYQDHPMDHQNHTSYQDHQMNHQAIYSNQESHLMEQQSLDIRNQLADRSDHQSIHSQLQNQQLRLQILAQLQRQELVYSATDSPSQDQSQTQPQAHMSYTPTQHQEPSPYMQTQSPVGLQPSHCLYTQSPQSPLTPVEPTSPWYLSPQTYPNSNPSYGLYPQSPHPHPNSNSRPQTKYSPRPNPTYSPHPNHSPYSYPNPSPQSNASPHSNHPSSSPSSASPYTNPSHHTQSSHSYGQHNCQPNAFPNHSPYYNPNPIPGPLPNSPPVLSCGGWGTGRGVSPESKGPHLSQLSYLRRLNHARPLCSPPAQQIQATLTEQTKNDETSNCRLLCSMCQRVFRSLPALNGHLRSHGGLRGQTSKTHTPRMREGAVALSPVPMVMPVSVPIRPSAPPALGGEECPEAERDGRRGWKKKKQRHQPSPLVLPCPSSWGGTGVFRSLLRSSGVSVAYTPAPMLCPDRAGTGIFCSLMRGNSDLVTPEKQLAKIKPRINVGVGFQAEVPPLQEQRHARSDPHNAVMLWTAWGDLENPYIQHRVDCLLTMSCSSVCPGGGTNSEYALHSLSKSKGDFMVTLEEMLLEPWIKRQTTNPGTPYHYAGSDIWSPIEKRLVNKAFRMYKKDFHSIHTMVGSKSVSQCVEYYYTWKRRLRLNVRTSVGLSNSLPEGNARTTVKLSSTQSEDHGGIIDRDGIEADCSPTNRKLSINRSPERSEPTASSNPFLISGGYSDEQPSLNGQTVLHTKSTQNDCQLIPSDAICPVLDAGPGGFSPVRRVPDKPHRTHSSGPVCLRASPSSASSSPTSNISLHPSCFKPHPQPSTLYPCMECTKVFSKVKSRNAHMKTHRQQDGQRHLEQLD